VAGFVAIAGRHDAGATVSASAADVGAVGIVLGAALLAHMAFSWQLFKQNGRLLARVADLEAAVGAPAQGLAVGDAAPAFALPDLEGRIVSLEALLRPGHGAVVVFTDPDCGHCDPLLPALGRPRGADEPALAVVSRGSREANRAKAREHGIAPLLLQRDFEVAAAYGTYGMPSAFAIDAAGRIAGPRAGGAGAVAELLTPPRLHIAYEQAGEG
jgi:peroxiredoxin